jgi:hypothetical protein
MSANPGAAVEVNGSEIIIRIQSQTPANGTSERLICLEKEACIAEGFELRGLQAKVRVGELPVVKIGRHSYVRFSDLCALAKPLKAQSVMDDLAYTDLVGRQRRRRERTDAA